MPKPIIDEYFAILQQAVSQKNIYCNLRVLASKTNERVKHFFTNTKTFAKISMCFGDSFFSFYFLLFRNLISLQVNTFSKLFKVLL